jgi:predicted ABC-type ATPase
LILYNYMPNLYIIAGCNGAGKTTASFTVLPELLGCREFVNADEIARGLSPFQPEKVAIEAGRIMLSRIDSLINSKQDFAFETTLSSKWYVRTIERAKANGYFVTLVFFWLEKVELAVERVKIRVTEGGHNIPEEVIRRKYSEGNIEDLSGILLSCTSQFVINGWRLIILIALCV